MNQERSFQLFIDGRLTYNNQASGKEKGIIIIDKDTKFLNKGSGKYQIALPSKGKLYNLSGKDVKQCPEKTNECNCDIKDWAQAIELVIQLKAL